MMWPGVAQQVCVGTSPVVFFREEMELLPSEEGHLDTQNKHTLSMYTHFFTHTVNSVGYVQVCLGTNRTAGELPGRAAQYSFGQTGFLQQLSVWKYREQNQRSRQEQPNPGFYPIETSSLSQVTAPVL